MAIADPPIRAPAAPARLDGVHLVARSYDKGVHLETHMHREAQLVYAARGTMQVTTPKGRWLVPPSRAVWVPGRLPHAIDMASDIEMRTMYFDPAWLAQTTDNTDFSSEFVVDVSPLLHQAILALFDGRKDTERAVLLVRLALHELSKAQDPATFLPLPSEPRCRRAAEIILAHPVQAPDITNLADRVGASGRTLSRLFAAETQMSFKSWCQRARVASAIERLSVQPGLSVKQLAADMGYASVPAFSHAFRQVTGRSPTEFAGRNIKSAHRTEP